MQYSITVQYYSTVLQYHSTVLQYSDKAAFYNCHFLGYQVRHVQDYSAVQNCAV